MTRAIVRPPGRNFVDALTTASLGVPDLAKARLQHEAYCAALESCGVRVIRLPAEDEFPDATFVEDTAVLTHASAILTRPGAASRAGEVDRIRDEVRAHYAAIDEMTVPATLDGGDVCEADGHFLIGISARTNEEGARQLSEFLSREGYSAECVDIREIPGLLHLKSGLSYLGNRTFMATRSLAASAALRSYETIVLEDDDSYASNCVRLDGSLLLPSGFDRVEKAVRAFGLRIVTVDTSEFQKVDGGLSCLSLRF